MGGSVELNSGKVAGDLRIIFGSEIRINILIALSEKPTTLASLVETTGRRAQLILRNIKDLEHLNLLERKGRGKYQLTSAGRILAQKAADLIKLLEVLRKHRNFWFAHDIEALPDFSLRELGALANSKLIESTANSSTSVMVGKKILMEAEERIFGVTSINNIEWKKAVTKAAQKGVKLFVVTSREVVDISTKGEFKPYTIKLLSSPNVDWRINDNIRLALGVTEKAMGLMLYTRDGLPDARRILVSENPQALKWGEEVYKYYRERSEPLDRKSALLKLN